MSPQQDTWTAVDRYFADLLIGHDDVLDEVLRASNAAKLPAIAVSPAQGKLLHLLARMQGARRILEIGTLAGYSTIWLARALPPDGTLVTLEADPKHAEIARGNLHRAGLSRVVEVRLGRALETLPTLESQCRQTPFDLIFIDADKPALADYFEWSLKLSRPGTVIIADNVVRDGKVIDAGISDASVKGVRRFNELLARDRRVSATAIQTVGSKGYDGFAIAVVAA
jgi:predicted O-methyltransferase YrrM